MFLGKFGQIQRVDFWVLEVCPQSHSFDVIAFGILIVLNYYMFNEGQSLLLITVYCIMCLSNKGIQGMYLI